MIRINCLMALAKRDQSFLNYNAQDGAKPRLGESPQDANTAGLLSAFRRP